MSTQEETKWNLGWQTDTSKESSVSVNVKLDKLYTCPYTLAIYCGKQNILLKQVRGKHKHWNVDY